MTKREAKYVLSNNQVGELRLAQPDDCWPGTADSLPKPGLWFKPYKSCSMDVGDLTGLRWVEIEELKGLGFGEEDIADARAALEAE